MAFSVQNSVWILNEEYQVSMNPATAGPSIISSYSPSQVTQVALGNPPGKPTDD